MHTLIEPFRLSISSFIAMTFAVDVRGIPGRLLRRKEMAIAHSQKEGESRDMPGRGLATGESTSAHGSLDTCEETFEVGSVLFGNVHARRGFELYELPRYFLAFFVR
jgi:hypothetical protein